MQLKDLQMKRALRVVLIVLLLSEVGLTNVLAQTQGMLNGKFTVNSSGKQVRFSQGNLQYRASTHTWRFAEEQFEYVGTGNSNVSSTYNGWIDLFGWGTSGYNHGANCYEPWSTSAISADYYAYGSSMSNLYSNSGKADWGYNAISNGGNQENIGWRTLTDSEWYCVLFTRSTTSGKRFAKARINETNGVILLPDDWTPATYNLKNTNKTDVAFNSNVLDFSQWTILENAGAVFFPVAGYRSYINLYCINVWALYWSSTSKYGTPTHACSFVFGNGYLRTDITVKSNALSVRLVRDVDLSTSTINVTANPTEGGMVSGGGTYDIGATCTVTATANDGYTFAYWTENGTVVSTNASYSFTVTDNSTLVANFNLNSYNISALASPTTGGTIYGGGTFIYGTTCNLIAIANSGYTFTNWTEDGTEVSTNAIYSFTVTSNRNLVANFTTTPQNYTISVSANPSNSGTVTGAGTYAEGVSCTVTATPNNGYSFTNWTENDTVVSIDASYSFTVTSNRTLVANFSLNSYNISVVANPTTGGTITGGGSYTHGTTCNLMATANSGYTFINWTESGTVVSTDASYSFTVTDNRNLVANFSLNSYTISALANPTAGGTITGGGTYDYGASCTLTATANSGYAFTNWTENDSVVSADAVYSFTVTGDRNLVANFELCSYSITALVNPEMSGTVTGSGSYLYGNNCTLTATANEGYTFINWTKGSDMVSTDATYSFTVTESGEYVANFELISYQITTTVNPTEGGMVTGGGTYVHGSTCTLTAVANEDYAFSNWTENGIVVSTDTVYSFTVSSHKDLVANFTHVGTGGLLNGLFSVGNNTKVYFSQGNLQYQASTDTWRFATNQYDHIGEDNANISQTYDGWIDLFGWGTSGYNHGAVCYQPWSTSQTNSDYYAYGIDSCNLFDQTGQADWGYNAISNGGNQPNYWRTLTYAEWYCVCNTRNTPSGIRYAKAQVNDIYGLILLPDNWSTTIYSLSSPNTPDASFSSNVISLSQWAILEDAGAVFLPVTGTRGGASVYWMDRAHYWSSKYYNSNWATALSFGIGNNDESYFGFYADARNSGHAVRLVRTVTYTVNTTTSPIGGGTVIGSGTYDSGETCTLTATANDGYAFVNWTENENAVSTNSTISFIVSSERNVVANFLYIGTEEMINGLFSVSNNTKVCFSQGNLQYQASTDTWRFADHQWDYVGGTAMGVHYGNVGSSSNSNISSTYDGWIDLFGWGTSGWDNGNTYYHPWDSNYEDHTLYGPSPDVCSLVGDYANADWGVYNPISNGGNQANQWRTLTYWEYNYLLDTRTTLSGIRYAKAEVNGVNGLILVPDNWDSAIYELQNVNTSESSYDSNVISLPIWINTFEANGAVFLPAAGNRFYGNSLFYLNSKGGYWLSTGNTNTGCASILWFSNEGVSTGAGYRATGLSVRLVKTIQHRFITTGNWSTPSNWSTGALPGANDVVFIDAPCQLDQNATVAALTVSNGQSLILQSGKTLTVTGNLINTATTGLVIEDGAQLIHNVADVQATVKKAISQFSGTSDGWHLIALPLTGSINVASVTNLLEGEYDLYGYDEATTYWRNQKHTESGFTALEATKGYLYANSAEVTLGFSGTLENSSAAVSVPLSYTNGANLSGFNLVGNPFPCNAYLDREYYTLSTDGTDINPEAIPATTPIPPGTAVFVKAEAEGETVVFTRVVQ